MGFLPNIGPAEILSQLLVGLSRAMILFTVCSGLSFVLGVLRVPNIAHGSLYMIGAFATFGISKYIGGAAGFWLALLLAPLVVAAISLGLVGAERMSERLGRNVAFASAGTGLAAAAMGAIGYYLSNRAVFLLAGAVNLTTGGGELFRKLTPFLVATVPVLVGLGLIRAVALLRRPDIWAE